MSIADLRRGLGAIGYAEGLVQERYRFADYSGTGTAGTVRTIDLAAFGQEPPSTKTACIGAVLGERTADELVPYRALGAPQILALANGTVDRWMMVADGPPKWLDRFPSARLLETLTEKRAEWGPQAILRAKAISFDLPAIQLDFFDLGLVPTVERIVRKKLNDLLSTVVSDTLDAYSARHNGPRDFQGLFRLIFRLLAAKLLADRQHEGRDWLMGTPADVLKRVEQFYFSDQDGPVPKAWGDPTAQATAWKHISESFHLENVSLDTLAWIWEHTFVNKEVRHQLSIHATPPELAEYVVRRLPFENVPPDQLRIFEPFAGQAVFLVAALGRIRELLLAEQPGLSSSERHERFVRMLTGMELDSFALEVARLALMLADYPHPAGWNLLHGDVFKDPRLPKLLSSATAILCNPPFGKIPLEERSSLTEREVYDRADAALTRLLVHPPALLGFVLPRLFRSGKRFREARRRVAQTYRSVEITELPDSLFAHSDAESVLLIAHGRGAQTTKLLAKTVQKDDLEHFLRTGEPTSVREATITPEQAEVALWCYELERVWSALKDHPRLNSIATPRRGIEYQKKLRYHRAELTSIRPREGFRPGIQNVSEHFEPFFVGQHEYLNMDPRVIRRKAYLHPWHLAKVLVNRHRRTRGAWRLIAVPDYSGLVGSENFHGVWPTGDVPVEVIAAILNGYVANAFVSVMEEGRDIDRATLSEIPIPTPSEAMIKQLTDFVSLYRVERAELRADPSRQRANRCEQLLEHIDTIVLNAYDLPSVLERELVEFFADQPRPGLDMVRQGYGSPTDATIPLPLDHAELEQAQPPSGTVDEADAAFEAGLARLSATLRSDHPELFDDSGDLRLDEALRLLARRADGKRVLSRAELLALNERSDGRPPDAT